MDEKVFTPFKSSPLLPIFEKFSKVRDVSLVYGDPIEMQALGEIFRARNESAPPVHVSSVKANVGHMETVSGVAGLIKVPGNLSGNSNFLFVDFWVFHYHGCGCVADAGSV